jgi:hypothetical protein
MNADSPVLWEGDLAQLPGQLPVHRRFRRSSAANIPFFLITQLQPTAMRQGPAAMHVQGIDRNRDMQIGGMQDGFPARHAQLRAGPSTLLP